MSKQSGQTRREPGYYWVNWYDKWDIAYYNIDGWIIHGLVDAQADTYWKEIDERRIEREPQPKPDDTIPEDYYLK